MTDINLLLLFTTSVICLYLFIYIGIKSQLRQIYHRIIFLFIVNFGWVFFERFLSLSQLQEGKMSFYYLDLAPWYAFGPLLWCYIYFTIYPKSVTSKNRYWPFLFVPFLFEIVLNLLFALHISNSELFSSSYVIDILEFRSLFLKKLSFYFFLVFLVITIGFVWYGQLFKKYVILQNIRPYWVWLLLILIASISLCELLLFEPYLGAVQYSLVLLTVLYLNFFLSFNSNILGSSLSDKKELLRQVFMENEKPVLLVNAAQEIVYANKFVSEITGFTKPILIGKTLKSLFLDVEGNLDYKTKNFPLSLVLKTKKEELLKCSLKIEPIQYDLQSNYFVLYIENYEKIGLHINEKEEQILEKLMTLFQEKKMFLRSDLQQSDVAAELSISSRKLGELLAKHSNISFPSYVNSMRVAYAKLLLVKPDNSHLSLEAIGENAGFSSKSSFYTIFKKFTGVSPGDFQKNN